MWVDAEKSEMSCINDEKELENFHITSNLAYKT